MSWWVFKNNYFYFRILSDLQEHFRDSTESSHKSCTHFPVINIFHYRGHARQLKNQYWHIIVNESPFYTQSSLVLTQGPFQFQDLIQNTSLRLVFMCPWAWRRQFLRTSFGSDDFISLQNVGRLFCATSLGWDGSDVSSCVERAHGFGGRKST